MDLTRAPGDFSMNSPTSFKVELETVKELSDASSQGSGFRDATNALHAKSLRDPVITSMPSRLASPVQFDPMK